MSLANPSIVTPIGYDAHTCGYCKSKADTAHTYGAWAHTLRPLDYQRLIDYGWRRSGAYMYKPRMSMTCCPQYTIRLDLASFKPSKQHRQALNRFRRYLSGEWTPSDTDAHMIDASTAEGTDGGEVHAPVPANVPQQRNTASAIALGTRAEYDNSSSRDSSAAAFLPLPPKQPKSKAAKNAPFDYLATLRELVLLAGGKHKLRTVLEPASCTPAKLELYRAYQVTVHKDPPSKITERSLTRFLVDSPLNTRRFSAMVSRANSVIAGHPVAKQPEYGSFHLCYYLDDVLIGVSVIDLLPWCVSSVYFFYHPEKVPREVGIGKISAIMEMAVAREEWERRGNAGHMYLYMGYYVPGCVKMEYKGQFHGSELLDPVSYVWAPLDDQARARLGPESDHGFARLDPAVSNQTRKEVPDERMDRNVDDAEAAELMVLVEGGVMPLELLKEHDEAEYDKIVTCARKMDAESARDMVFAP